MTLAPALRLWRACRYPLLVVALSRLVVVMLFAMEGWVTRPHGDGRRAAADAARPRLLGRHLVPLDRRPRLRPDDRPRRQRGVPAALPAAPARTAHRSRRSSTWCGSAPRPRPRSWPSACACSTSSPNERFGRAIARRTVLFLSISPLAFVFSAVYAESLFLVLAAGTFLLAERGRFLGAVGRSAALGVLTRPVGLALVPALALDGLGRARGPLEARRCRSRCCRWPRPLFPAYLWWETGDLLAQTHAQARGWGRSLGLPPLVIWNAFTGPVLDRHELRFLVHICFALVWTVMLVELWKRRDEVPIPYLLFAAGCVLLPFAAGSLVSAGRIGMLGFPLFWALAILGPPRGHRHDGQGRLAGAHGRADLRDLRHTARSRREPPGGAPARAHRRVGPDQLQRVHGERALRRRGRLLRPRRARSERAAPSPRRPIAAPFLARALAADLRALWERLGRPAPFTVAEIGPGDGSLAAGLAAELADLPLDARAVRARGRDARPGAGPRSRGARRRARRAVGRQRRDRRQRGARRLPGASPALARRAARRRSAPTGASAGRPARRPAVSAIRCSPPASRRGRRPRVRRLAGAGRAAARARARARARRARSRSTTARPGAGRYERPVPRLRTYLGGMAGGDPLAAPGHAGHHGRRRLRRRARAPARPRACARRSTSPQPEWLLAHGAAAGDRELPRHAAERLWLEALSDPQGSGSAFRVLVQERE